MFVFNLLTKRTRICNRPIKKCFINGLIGQWILKQERLECLTWFLTACCLSEIHLIYLCKFRNVELISWLCVWSWYTVVKSCPLKYYLNHLSPDILPFHNHHTPFWWWWTCWLCRLCSLHWRMTHPSFFDHNPVDHLNTAPTHKAHIRYSP